MRNSKLYSILAHFDKYEQNRFRKYILSPYFNKDQTLIDLFEHLIAHVNERLDTEVDKEKLWQHLNIGKQYDDVRFRKYCSDLLKLVEGFLAQHHYEQNTLHQATYLMEAVGKKKMDKLYNSTLKTVERLSEQQKFRPSSFYYYQYEIEKNYYELTQSEMKRTDKSNVENIILNLDYFYLAEKLRLYCSVLSRQYVVSHEYQLLFIDEIIQHIQKFGFEDIPAISVYYQIYLTQVESDNEAHYFKLKELLTRFGHVFPQKEAYVIYTYAMNYCIRRTNRGVQQFLKELFELYKELIEKEIIFTEAGLSPWDFKNIVQCALQLGEYSWAEEFINTHSSKLPENLRDNAVTYSLAQIYFYQKKHEKVISLLQTVEYEDFTYNLGSKSMLLATYYEMDELEPLYSLFESFRTYLNRHKDIPAQRRKNYSNLIKYTKKLTKIMPGDKKAVEHLKQEIEVVKNVASINWLKEKIGELE